MKEEAIRKYASLMRELDLSGLEVKEDGYELRLERGSRSASPAPETYIIEDEAPAAAKGSSAKEEGTIVSSPMVGVFYAAPAPGAEPFVQVGSKVKKGDTLCVIEAMKVMNEVTAEQDGEIVDICVKDGDLVEYGCCLMKVY